MNYFFLLSLTEASLYADKLSLDYQKENPDIFDGDGNLMFENPYTVWVTEK